MTPVNWQDPAVRDLVARLYPLGQSVEIARELGCSLRAVQRGALRMGVASSRSAARQQTIVRKAHAKPVSPKEQAGMRVLFGSPRPSKAKPTGPVSIDYSRARTTIADPFEDLRYAPEPGHVGEFASLGIGRYAA